MVGLRLLAALDLDRRASLMRGRPRAVQRGMATPFESGGRFRRQRRHHHLVGVEGRTQRLLVQPPDGPPRPWGKPEVRFTPHLGRARADQVECGGGRPDQPAGVGQGVLEDLFEASEELTASVTESSTFVRS